MARQAILYLEYEGQNVSANISSSILSFSYTDNASNNADEIQLRLENSEGLWEGLLYPVKGGALKASIISEDWDFEGSVQSLPCGMFEIDEIQFSGPPDIIEIKAVSIPISSNIRGEKKTKAWEMINLKKIAEEIAAKSNLKLIYDYNRAINYARIEQINQSDLEFLSKLCKNAGLSLKISDKKIIIFDEKKYEEKNTVRIIKKWQTDLLNYNFKTNSRDLYKSAEINYNDIESGEEIKTSFTPSNAPKVGKILRINESSEFVNMKKAPVGSKKVNAKQKAEKLLREKNKNEFQACIKLTGDIKLCAASTIYIDGFGIFDGKYFIEKSVHNIDGSGYTTEIEIRKVLEGY